METSVPGVKFRHQTMKKCVVELIPMLTKHFWMPYTSDIVPKIRRMPILYRRNNSLPKNYRWIAAVSVISNGIEKATGMVFSNNNINNDRRCGFRLSTNGLRLQRSAGDLLSNLSQVWTNTICPKSTVNSDLQIKIVWGKKKQVGPFGVKIISQNAHTPDQPWITVWTS